MNLKELSKFETNDYQRRNGNYPKANVADSIEVWDDGKTLEIKIDFKNTSEDAAKEWTTKWCKSNNIQFKGIATAQTGDYHNDWVSAYVMFV